MGLGSLLAAMREFRRPGLWLGIWIFGWVLCVVLSLIHPPRIDIDVPDGDKIGHFLAYGTLSAWAVMIFARTRSRWWAAFSLVLLGIAMEFAQGAFTNYRMMDPMDALADTIGVLLGQFLALGRGQTLLQAWDLRIFR
jgi:VanZ family protein